MWEHLGPPNFDTPPDWIVSILALVIKQLEDMAVSESTGMPTAVNHPRSVVFNQAGNAEPIDRRSNNHVRGFEGELPAHAHVRFLAPVSELPGIEPATARQPEINACALRQVAGFSECRYEQHTQAPRQQLGAERARRIFGILGGSVKQFRPNAEIPGVSLPWRHTVIHRGTRRSLLHWALTRF